MSFIDLAYFNGVLRGIDNTVKCSGIVNNTINKLEGHDLYFELGDKTVFQGSFKSEGLPDVWNTRFHIDLYKAHLNPDDLETVYCPGSIGIFRFRNLCIIFLLSISSRFVSKVHYRILW